MNEKTLQDHIDAVIAEFEKKIKSHGCHSCWSDDHHCTCEEERATLRSWLPEISSALSSSIQDFIRATEVEGDIVDEFLRATPEWLKSLDVWDEGQGCKMCGAKYGKIKRLHEILSTQKEKIKHYLGNG